MAERYAPGFRADMPFLGWSMAKSATNALIGILVQKGMLNIYEPAPVPEWSGLNDPRRRITVDQLLRRSSGLQFEETYKPLHGVTRMLYRSPDFAAFAAAQPRKPNLTGNGIIPREPPISWPGSSAELLKYQERTRRPLCGGTFSIKSG